MAESAVSLLIEYLGPLLVEEVKLLKGVRGEVRKIKDELESMQAFLRDADAREDNNESIKAWVRQVRYASHDIENILDEFMICTRQYGVDYSGVFGILHKMINPIKQLKARRRIGKQIQDMRNKLSDISRRKDYYNLNRTEQTSNLSNSEDELYDLRVAALFAEESKLVGIDGPKTQLVGWLLGKEQRLVTIAVVGMGGLGKTTLVKKVYDSEKLKEGFETFAWITVSQSFKKKDLLQNMMGQFNMDQAPSGVDSMSEVQLIQQLRDYLEDKRFVLVLDDVWEMGAWKFFSLVLPSRENNSRVILTTRRRDVASSCCLQPSDHIYELQPLNPNMAQSLFCRRAFPASEGNSCPPELQILARSFVKKCQGLPLAIVTLGGLLASKDQTYSTWETIHNGLGTELESDSFGSMMKILWLSFNDLPYYLKSCYLYLSIFPEDYLIGSRQIIGLWRAEGLITSKEGRMVEEVGKSYLDALITRSLVGVWGGKNYGPYFGFRIHDLLREVIISKSRDENLSISSIDDNMALSHRIRRLSIIHRKDEIVPKFESSSCLRSLLVFGGYGLSTASCMISFAGLHLLRVVSIQSVSIDSFPDGLTSLVLLRFLGLFNTKIKCLPSSVGKLINLETLILENNFICELPLEICRLQRLRNLSVRNASVQISHEAYGAKVPSGVGSLKFLHELRRVQAERGAVRELGNLIQLKILAVHKLRREDGRDLCISVEKMSRLQSLEVTSIREDEEIDLHPLSCPPTLQELFLRGYLKKLPNWITTLQNLLVLSLQWSRLKDDPLEALSSLRNLLELKIVDAYDGEEICVKEGEYPKLRELLLHQLRGLKKVTVEKGAMPNLEILSIEGCQVLVDVPSWIGRLINLKQLFLTDMPMPFLKNLRRDDGEDRVDFIHHIPLINYRDSLGQRYQKF